MLAEALVVVEHLGKLTGRRVVVQEESRRGCMQVSFIKLSQSESPQRTIRDFLERSLGPQVSPGKCTM